MCRNLLLPYPLPEKSPAAVAQVLSTSERPAQSSGDPVIVGPISQTLMAAYTHNSGTVVLPQLRSSPAQSPCNGPGIDPPPPTAAWCHQIRTLNDKTCTPAAALSYSLDRRSSSSESTASRFLCTPQCMIRPLDSL